MLADNGCASATPQDREPLFHAGGKSIADGFSFSPRRADTTLDKSLLALQYYEQRYRNQQIAFFQKPAVAFVMCFAAVFSPGIPRLGFQMYQFLFPLTAQDDGLGSTHRSRFQNRYLAALVSLPFGPRAQTGGNTVILFRGPHILISCLFTVAGDRNAKADFCFGCWPLFLILDGAGAAGHEPAQSDMGPPGGYNCRSG
jgi:hypothetical protein